MIPDPAVSRKSLIKNAGIFWVIGGIILLYRGLTIAVSESELQIVLILVACAIGLIKGIFLFGRIVKTNIERIEQLAPNKDKVCLFAFQSLSSYLLVIVMVTFGLLLRSSGLPPNILMIVYLAIGIALLTGSIQYFSTSRNL